MVEWATKCVTVVSMSGETIVSINVEPSTVVREIMNECRVRRIDLRHFLLFTNDQVWLPDSRLADLRLNTPEIVCTAVLQDVKAMKESGHTARQLKTLGFSVEDLRDAGYSMHSVKHAGYALDLSNCTWEELYGAGYSRDELTRQVKHKGFSLEHMKAKGVPAEVALLLGNPIFEVLELYQDLPYEAFVGNVLVVVGNSAPKDLRAMGFSLLHHLVRSGLTVQQATEAGYSGEEILKALRVLRQAPGACFSVERALAAGYTLQQVEEAGYSYAAIRFATAFG